MKSKVHLYRPDRDKIIGVILGHATGDALGAPIEFYPYTHYTGELNGCIERFRERTVGKKAL